MKGRLENDLKRKREIQNILSTMPEYVTDFYYKLQSDTETVTGVIYLRRIRHFINYINKDITQVTETDIGKYLESISYKTDKAGEVTKTSHAYKQITWTALNHLFVFLKYRGLVTRNPMETIKRSKKSDEIKRVSLTVEDLNRILQAVLNGAGNDKAKAKQRKWKERDLLILYLFMNTGMRKTAVSEINIDDFELNEHILTVIDKGNKIQEYYLTPELEDIFHNWLQHRQELLGDQKSDALFINKNRERITSKGVYDLVKKYSKEGLGYSISPHKLRAAFVTIYYEASGNDIEATRQAVGHSNITTTSRYIVKKNNSRAEAANFMSQSLRI